MTTFVRLSGLATLSTVATLSNVATVATVAAVATLAGLASPAAASPEVRDHRTPAPAASPTVRDHRDAPAPSSQVRYRRRPGPRLMMPLKVDLGAAGANTSRGFAPGIGAAIGIHWASLSPRPTDTDVGIGVFGAILAAPTDPQMQTSDEDNGVAYGGAYLELGHTLARGSWWRTWASGRGEYVGSTAFGDTHAGFGATGRLSAELYVGGAGIDPRGVFLGTYAIGVYVEAGARDMASGLGMLHASTGLTFRTPLVLAF